MDMPSRGFRHFCGGGTPFQGHFMTLPSHPPARWFDESQAAAAVESLESELARIGDRRGDEGNAAPKHDPQKLALGVGAICLGMLLLLVVGLALFGKRDPNHQLDARGIVSLTLIFVVLPVGLYFGTKHFYGVKAKRSQERLEALKRLAARSPALAEGRGARITGESVGRIPWLASELDTVVECDLHGVYRGRRLALLECTYVVDMTLTALESSYGGVAAKVMSHVDHEHVHRRSLAAVVFLDPIESLPDVFWAGRKQPLNWYFKRQLQQNSVDGAAPSVEGGRWVVSSDPAQWRRSVQGCAPLLQARPEAIVEALGGYVVVIPQTWNCNFPTEMPNDEATIEADLAWACDVYEALGGAASPLAATAEPPALERSTPLPAAASPTASAPPLPERPSKAAPSSKPARQAKPVKPRSALQLVLGVAGMLLFGVGCVLLAGIAALGAKAKAAVDWPTVEGRTTAAEVQERGGPQYSARVRYQYEVGGQRFEGDKRTLATTEWLTDRAAIEAVVAKYQAGSPATVYYHPRDPRDAVLEPRLVDGGMGAFVSVASALFAAVGTLMMVFGFRRPK